MNQTIVHEMIYQLNGSAHYKYKRKIAFIKNRPVSNIYILNLSEFYTPNSSLCDYNRILTLLLNITIVCICLDLTKYLLFPEHIC